MLPRRLVTGRGPWSGGRGFLGDLDRYNRQPAGEDHLTQRLIPTTIIEAFPDVAITADLVSTVAQNLTSVSLAGSGVLAYIAAWQRWSGVCSRGGFDEPACLERQDHLYDYQVPASPWAPVGDAAQLYGLSALLLAVAAFALPFLWAPAGRRLVTWPLAVIPAIALVGVGAVAVASGMAGRLVIVPGFDLTALLIVHLFWPLALVVYASGVALWTYPTERIVTPAERLTAARSASMVMTSLLIAGTTALPTYFFIAPIAAGYMSHDTTPWSEAPAGVLLVLAAVLVWPATARVMARPASDLMSPAEEALF